MNARIDTYLTLERLMLQLDEVGDPLADHIRDLMDPVWYELPKADRATLDRRAIEVNALNPIRFSASPGLYLQPLPLAREYTPIEPRNGVGRVMKDWRVAA